MIPDLSVYDVLVPTIYPALARAGDRLVVTRGHPVYPLAVVRRDRGGWRRVATGAPDERALQRLEAEGIIRQRLSVSRSPRPSRARALQRWKPRRRQARRRS